MADNNDVDYIAGMLTDDPDKFNEVGSEAVDSKAKDKPLVSDKAEEKLLEG